MKLKHLFLFIYLLTVKYSFSQTQEQLFKKFHSSINITNIYTKYQHQNIKGDINFMSPFSPGFILGTKIMYNLKPYLGIETGISLCHSAYNYYIPPDLYAKRSPYTYTTNSLGLPVNIEYHLQLSKSLYFSASGGICLNKYPVIDNYLNLIHENITVITNVNTWESKTAQGFIISKGTLGISYDFTFSIIYAFKHSNYLKIGPSFRYFKENNVYLYYISTQPAFDVEGKLHANGSYFGFNAAFVFTNLLK